METSAPTPSPLLERFKYPIFFLIGGAIIAGIAVLLWQRPEPTAITVIPPESTPIPSPTLIPSATPTPDPYTVYITGAVARPEIVVTLPYNSRVIDALAAAGGPLDNANLERVNLAQVLNDGDQIQVPTREPGNKNSPSVASVIVVTPTPGSYTIYVTGEVIRAQTMLSLPAGSRVEDAIQAAGGTTDNADMSRVNLSQQLNDGDQVHVPPLTGTDIQTPTPNHPLLVHINTATLEELDALPGVGPVLAQTIIDYRTQNGPFADPEELDQVPGIGPSTLENIRDQVVYD